MERRGDRDFKTYSDREIPGPHTRISVFSMIEPPLRGCWSAERRSLVTPVMRRETHLLLSWRIRFPHCRSRHRRPRGERERETP